jgi:hypothetical protein
MSRNAVGLWKMPGESLVVVLQKYLQTESQSQRVEMRVLTQRYLSLDQKLQPCCKTCRRQNHRDGTLRSRSA